MFESIESESLIAIARRKTREWRGISRWPSTDATVWSCVWKEDGEGSGSFKTSFTYKVAEVRYTGSFSQSGGWESNPPFAVDEPLTVQYNPTNPQQCFYANAFTTSEKAWIGVIILLLFFLIHWLVTGSILPDLSSTSGD